MRISYAIQEGDDFDPCDTFEIALAMSEVGDSIWLCVNGRPLRALPEAFNRIVFTSGGDVIHSAVLSRRELIPLEPHETGPLPPEAPLLVIDDRHKEVHWREKVIYEEDGAR